MSQTEVRGDGPRQPRLIEDIRPRHRITHIVTPEKLLQPATAIVTNIEARRGINLYAIGMAWAWILLTAFGLLFSRPAQAALPLPGVKQGSFTKPTAAGSQAVTGLGFKPAAVIFYWTAQTADGTAAEALFGTGVASSSTTERSISSWSDGSASSDSGRKTSQQYAITMQLADGTNAGTAGLTSFDRDGFTLNWATSDANARVVQYMAISDKAITNAKSGTIQMTTSGATQADNTVGFQPDFMMFFSANLTTNDTNTANANYSLGFAAGASNEAGYGIVSEDAQATGDTCSKQLTTAAIVLMLPTFGTIANCDAAAPTEDAVADVASFDANGFTLNKTNLPAAATDVHYLALKGASFNVGAFNKPTTATTSTVSGLAAQPEGLFLTSTNKVSSAAVTASAYASIGATSAPNVEGSVGIGDADADASPDPDSRLSRTKALSAIETSAATLTGEADLLSFNPNGFTLNWTTADATADQILYWTIGPPGKYPKITQSGYTFENDDASSGVDNNTAQAGSTFTTGKTITSAKKGERLTLRTQAKNTGNGSLGSNMALFYDRGDGIWSKVKSKTPPVSSAGNCTNTNWDCSAIASNDDTGSSTSTAISPNGTPYVSYHEYSDSGATVSVNLAQYVGSGGSGCGATAAWTCTVIHSMSPANGGINTSLAFSPSGVPYISYHLFHNSNFTGSVYVAHYVGSSGTGCATTAWTCTAIETPSSPGYGEHSSIAFNPSGNAWVSYNDLANNRLKVAQFVGSGGSGCGATAAWTCTVVDDHATDNLGQYNSLAFDAKGNAWASYYDLVAGRLKVAQYVGSGGNCDTAPQTGSDAWNCTVVDDHATDNLGLFTSLAFDSAGNPWISYRDGTNARLKVASFVGSGGNCDTAPQTGSDAWNCTVVDDHATDNLAQYTSIAFDAGGNAWVSYREINNSMLKVAQYVGSGGNCDTAPQTGSDAWNCTVVDDHATDNLGEQSSIAFDAGGNAWVSYRNTTGLDLKMAQIKRGGEIVINAGTPGVNGATLSESHADMTAATDTTNRDDADCLGGGTWNNGKWFESEEASGLSLSAGSATAQCTEVAFTIDTSQAVAGRTYRFVIASKDNWRDDRGIWRGPIAVSTDAHAILTIEADTTQRFSKDNSPKFSDCTDTTWGCQGIGDQALDITGTSLAFDPSGQSWVSYYATEMNLGTDNLIACSSVCAIVTSAPLSLGAVAQSSIAIDPSGNPWISYYYDSTSNINIARYVGSGGTGCTSTAWTCTAVDSSNVDGAYASLAFDPAGNAFISYTEMVTGVASLNVARYVGSGGTGCASTEWTCTKVDDPANAVGYDTSIAFDPSGVPWISYKDLSATSLKVARYVGNGGTGCSSTDWACTTVDNTGTNTGDDTSIAFDSSGNPWISSYDSTNTSLRVATKGGGFGSTCTDTGWTCGAVDNDTGNTGQTSSIAFDSNNKAFISYYDATSGIQALMVAKYVGTGGSGCGASGSTAWACSIVDNTAVDTGKFTSLAFDASGIPWISYKDDTNLTAVTAKLHNPPHRPTFASQIKNPGRNAGRGDLRYPMTLGKTVTAAEGSCSSNVDNAGYCGVYADDTFYDSVTTFSSERPIFNFSKRNANNTDTPTATWIGRSNIAPSVSGTDGDLVLQVYRFGTTNAWETIDTETVASNCNTADCTLSGGPVSNLSQYYEADGANYQTYFRVWQYENISAETLKTDSFAVAFSGGGGGNTAPASPAPLAQKKTDDTVVATGDWINDTSIKLTATVTDPDAGDSIKICAEVDPITTAFSSPAGDGDGCSVSGVASGGTATVTVSGLSSHVEYHWQIKAKDTAAAYSSWVTYGGNTENPPTNPAGRDFGVDTSAPSGGIVYDGTSLGVDEDFNNGSLTVLSANWASFDSSAAGLSKYQYSIGTTSCGTDIRNWTDNSTTTSVTATSLTLNTSSIYYFGVRAVDNAGNTQACVASDGQMVLPDLSFTLSSNSVSFANLNGSNSWTDTKTTTLTTTTNAFNGYVIRAYATDLLRSATNTIGDFNGGSYALPDTWQSGDTGFGYTSSDVSVQGSNKFQNNPCPGGTALAAPGCYAPFSQVAPGDIVADSATSQTAGQAFTITNRVTVSVGQPAKNYQTTLTYINTAVY